MDKLYGAKSLALKLASKIAKIQNELACCAHDKFDSDAIVEEIEDALKKLPRIVAKFTEKCENFKKPSDTIESSNK